MVSISPGPRAEMTVKSELAAAMASIKPANPAGVANAPKVCRTRPCTVFP